VRTSTHFALGCAGAGLSTLVIDRQDPAAMMDDRFDGRTSAIAYGSRLVFDGIGLWPAIEGEAEPIREIRVADDGSPLFLHYDHRELGGNTPLGYIVENRVLRRALFDRAAILPSLRLLAPQTVASMEASEGAATVALADGTRTYRVEVRAAGDSHATRIIVHKTEHGTPSHKYLPREFFESAEYQRIADLARTLAGLIGEGAYVTRGTDRQDIGSFKEAMKWLFDQARKGQTIQRYKGLGEMNPEQLWETTINPETRRLMQVRIEDAVAADDIFTTLMGDQVEPRREFIEKHALSVTNLDI